VLDQYIREKVTREEAEHAAATYVLVGPDVSAKICRVIGYFTLNSFDLAKKQTPRRDRDKDLGRYQPVPALLLGRLALEIDFHRHGFRKRTAGFRATVDPDHSCNAGDRCRRRSCAR
jgi:hypothetical protein